MVFLEVPQVFLVCAVRVENACAKQCSLDFYMPMNNPGILKLKILIQLVWGET